MAFLDAGRAGWSRGGGLVAWLACGLVSAEQWCGPTAASLAGLRALASVAHTLFPGKPSPSVKGGFCDPEMIPSEAAKHAAAAAFTWGRCVGGRGTRLLAEKREALCPVPFCASKSDRQPPLLNWASVSAPGADPCSATY